MVPASLAKAGGAAATGALAKASSVILGAKTLTITGIATGGAVAIGTAVAAAIGAALVGVGIGYLIQKPFLEAADAVGRIPLDLKKVRSEIQSLEKIQIPNLEIETNRYKEALYGIEQAFANGYETIKLTVQGLRSEFEKINDESGLTGFDARVKRAESVDELASGANDIVAQQNLRNTRDPFEKQRITIDRENRRDIDRMYSGERERAESKQMVKAGQEDFLTGISGLFEPNLPSLEEFNNAVLQAQADAAGVQGPIDPRKLAKPLTDNVFTTGVDSLDRVNYTGRNPRENVELTTSPTARDIGDIGNFVTGLETALGQKENQTELYDALKRVNDASENLTNSRFTTDSVGNIASNQKDNLQEFLKARDALKPLLERRGEAMIDPNSFMIQKEGEDTPVFDEQGYKAAVEGAAAGLEEIFNNYTDTQIEAAKAQTASFIKESAEREQINLNSLQKQKEILDQFIDNFNASFLQNAERGADLFAQALSPGAAGRGQENIEALKGQKLGKGLADGATFQKRQEGLISTINRLDSAKFFDNFGDPNKEGDFRTKFNIERLGGVDSQVLQKGLDVQSRNLQQEVSAQNADGTTNLVAQRINSNQGARNVVASSTQAFAPILEQIKIQATEAGDRNLVATIDKKLAVLNNDRATVPEKLAAGDVNLEGTRLSPEAQDEFQIQLIEAGGAIKAEIDKLKGSTAATESDALGEQIKGVAEKLTNLQDALKITVDDVTLPTVIKEFTTSTRGLTPIVDAFKTKISELETELSLRLELLNKYNTVEEGLLEIQEERQKREESLLGQVTKIITNFSDASKKAKLFADNFPPPPPPAAPQGAGPRGRRRP